MDKTIFPECDHPKGSISDHESNKRAVEIRQDIADFVITYADKISDVSGVKEFVAEHTHRSRDIVEAKKRLKRLANAKEKYEPLEKRVDACRKTLKDAETEFIKLYRPLGQTAFQAFIGGILEEQATFSERLAVFKRVQELQQKCDDLTSDPDTGFAQKAKAKAKQLTIKGTIKFEKMKVGKLEAKIGCQLVEAESEETVRCDLTSELLEQIAHHREALADCKLATQYAESALTKIADKICEAVPLQTIESSKTFDTEIKLCKKTIRESESFLTKSIRSLTSSLSETDSTSLPNSLIQLLNEVNSSKNDMTEQMRKAKKGISRVGSKAAVSVKRWWSGVSQRGKAIIALSAVICLLTGWFTLTQPWNNENQIASSQIAKSLQGISSETLEEAHEFLQRAFQSAVEIQTRDDVLELMKKDNVLSEIAEAQAKIGDIEGAWMSIKAIDPADYSSDFRRGIAIAEIAAMQAYQGDFHTAIITANKAPSGLYQCRAIARVAEIQWSVDRAAAEKTFQAARETETVGSFKKSHLKEIFRARARCGDYEGATILLKEILALDPSQSHRLLILHNLSAIQAVRGDVNLAIKTAIDSGLTPDGLFLVIVEALAKKSWFDRALSFVDSFGSEEFKAKALAAIILSQIKAGQRDSASKLVTRLADSCDAIPDERYIFKAGTVADFVVCIAELQGQNDAIKALSTISRTLNLKDPYLAESYWRFGQYVARTTGSPEEAEIWFAIAERKVSRLDDADLTEKFRLYRELAFAQASVGGADDANEWVGRIEKPLFRSYALIGIAEGLIADEKRRKTERQATGSDLVGQSRNMNRAKAVEKKTGRLLWEFSTGDAAALSVSIGRDGTVFVPAYGDGTYDDNKIYALDGLTGKKKWEFPILFRPSPAAIGADGTVFFTSWKSLIALDGKSGAKKWGFEVKGRDVFISHPSIGADGTIYFGAQRFLKRFYAVNGMTGTQKWVVITKADVFYNPVIGADGTVFFGSRDKKVYALDGKTGEKKWEFLGASVFCSPVIGADGTIYIGSWSQKILALDGKTGKKKWESPTGSDLIHSPTIGIDGTIYIGLLNKKVIALDGKTGKKKWEFKVEKGVDQFCPAIGSNGTIYFGSWKKIYAVDGKTGNKKWAFQSANAVTSSPTIGADGTLYIGTRGKVLAIKTDSPGLAKSPWPMQGQNPQHTSRAVK